MQNQNENEHQLALIYVIKKLGELLYAAAQVNDKRPDWNGRAQILITKGLETSLKAFRQGGIKSEQLLGLENLITEIDDILSHKK